MPVDETTTVSFESATAGDVGRQPGLSLADRLRTGRIVLALSGEPDGAPAARAAAALDRRYGCGVTAVQVLDESDVPVLAPVPQARTFSIARELVGHAPYTKDARRLARQLSEWLGQPNVWPVHISSGAAAYGIARFADDLPAALIVLGLRRHNAVDRTLRDETTRKVLRLTNTAMFAVGPRLRASPRCAVVAVDFGPSSVWIAHGVLDLLGSPTESEPVHLRLVHVDNEVDGRRGHTAGETFVHHLGVSAAFDQLVAELAAPPGVRVECVTRYGETATELLRCADESRADVIALGNRRRHLPDRSFFGSVTEDVIRDGRCSVLAIPVSPDA